MKISKKSVENLNLKKIFTEKNKNQGSVSAYCIAANTEQMRNKD